MTATMRAITRTTYGGPDDLRLSQVARPVPADGQVLVRVVAASPNMADWHFLTGTPWLVRPQLGLRRPRDRRFGTDVAGEVVDVGAGVTELGPGDRVFGTTGGSGFAEHVALDADRVATVPDGVDCDVAATLPIAGVTALQAVRDLAEVGRGDRVLVNGASGGVGHFAVQVARLLGARVTGVCSARNHDLVRSLGAEDVIDYTTTDYTTSDRQWDVVVDVQGNHSGAANRRVLADDGHWVMVGGPKDGRVLGPLPWAAAGLLRFAVAPQHAHMFVASETRDRLETLAGWVADGRLAPSIEQRFPLADAADAMRHLATGRTRGKLVIEVA